MVRVNKELQAYLERTFRSDDPCGLTAVSIPKGENLILQDKKVRNIYFIRSGIVKCFVRDENAREFILEFLGEGEILGEIEVFADVFSYSNVEALTNLSVFKMSLVDFWALLDTSKKFNILLLKALAVKLHDTAERIAHQAINNADYNLKKVQTLLSEQNLQISKRDLADYLGITLRSLNRSLNK